MVRRVPGIGIELSSSHASQASRSRTCQVSRRRSMESGSDPDSGRKFRNALRALAGSGLKQKVRAVDPLERSERTCGGTAASVSRNRLSCATVAEQRARRLGKGPHENDRRDARGRFLQHTQCDQAGKGFRYEQCFVAGKLANYPARVLVERPRPVVWV